MADEQQQHPPLMPEAAPQQQQAPMQQQAPQMEQVDVRSPDGTYGKIPKQELWSAIQQGYTETTPEAAKEYALQEQYGGMGQQALAGIEGAARGASFGLSTGLEKAIGVNPEDIRGRQEANPTTSILGEVGGLAATSLIPGAGAANVLREAGQGAATAVSLGGKGAGFISQVGADAVKGAVEATLFQGGTEIHKAFAEDPDQTTETAIADMGLAAVMGGVFGGAIGAGLRGAGIAHPEMAGRFVSEVDQAPLEAGDFRTTIQNSDLHSTKQKEGILAGLSKEKANSKEIKDAANRLGAPILEGMISDSPWVQKAEDSLINGAPTYSGMARQKLYGEGYQKAISAVDEALGEGSTYSKAELGNMLKDSIASQIQEQNAPIAQMYNELKQFHDVIPLSEKSAPAIARNIKNLEELRLAPSSPEGAMAKRVISEIENLKTVDDVKTYKSILRRSVSPTASSGEKRMAAILSDKLTDLEESSIERFARDQMKTPEAKAKILDLIEQRKTANTKYTQFIEKVKTLSEQLGKGRVYGVQDALNFIKDKLTPEEVTQRLFSKNNSEFLKFFAKEFPEQMEHMKAYQAGSLREAASKTGTLSPKVLFNQVNKLEPEIQKALFSSEALSKLKDAEIYLRAIPKDFNPSGTAGMSAFREFFKSPTGMAIANARDFGIEKFIKAVGTAPEVKQATALAKATVAGWNTTARAVKSIFNPDKSAMPSSITASVSARDKLAKMVLEYTQNPDKMLQMGDSNPVPQYNQSFASTSARAVQYLNSLRPDTNPKNPLDGKRQPSDVEKAAWTRQLDIAQNPNLVLKHIKDGTLIPQDLVTVQTIYPSFYRQISSQIQQQMLDHTHKDRKVPYKARIGLSLLLTQPLDSTMTPSSIVAAQPAVIGPNAKSDQQGGVPPKAKHSTSALSKMGKAAQTSTQSAEQRRLGND